MERDIVELFKKGMEMMRNGEYKTAEQLFKRAKDIIINAESN